MTDQITCPNCGGVHITANARGFSAGQALVGDMVLGPIGLLAGAAGNSKVRVTCLDCGTSWAAGGRERKAHTIAVQRATGGCLWRLLKVAAFIILAPFAVVFALTFAMALWKAIV